MKEVIYRVDESGYTVAVVEEGRVLEDYSATNNHWDSQGAVMEDGVPLETLRRWGRGNRLGYGQTRGHRTGWSRSRWNPW